MLHTNALKKFERIYESIGALCLLSIALLMFVDVVGRYFNNPIDGSFDIIEAVMALVAFWFLPILSRDGQHISVTIFKAESGLWAKIQNVFIELFCLAISLLMAYCLYLIASDFEDYGEVSLILGLPKAPIVNACAVVVVGMSLTHVSRLLRVLVKSENV